MFESLESRQLFSVTLTSAAPPTTDTSTQPVIEADATAAKTTTPRASLSSLSITKVMDKTSPLM